MLQVELSKSQFLTLAERMASEALRTKSTKVEVSAFQNAMFIVDEDLGIEYMFSAEKSELWDFALELLATSNYIVLR